MAGGFGLGVVGICLLWFIVKWLYFDPARREYRMWVRDACPGYIVAGNDASFVNSFLTQDLSEIRGIEQQRLVAA